MQTSLIVRKDGVAEVL